jgi:hypothetical protein
MGSGQDLVFGQVGNRPKISATDNIAMQQNLNTLTLA